MGHSKTAFAATSPRWVMLGCDGPSKELPCRLIASAKLTRGELEIKMKYGPFFWDIGAYPDLVSSDATLTCRMYPPDIVIIDGETWQHCLAGLMRVWSPDTGKRQAITTGQQEIGDG